MKRCPACKRVEPDGSLAFCRADGTALVSDFTSERAETGTKEVGSAQISSETETSILPQTVTDAVISRPTGSTTVLDPQRTAGRTRELSKPKWRSSGAVVGAALLALVGIVAVVVGTRYFGRKGAANETSIESIAVLPFVNQNHDADSEYLSDGVTESIINSLTQLPNLRVIARSSVFHYKGKESDPLTAGNELGVRAVLTGRITQRGDNLIISTELTDVRDNKQLWGEKYERKSSDLMSLQRDIAGQIANNLRLKLSGEEHNRMMKHYTENPEAYQLYLKGRFYWNQRTGEALKKSIEYFNQAIAKDPSYALAYSGMADSYLLLAPYSVSSPQESYPQAKAAAKRALEIDDTLGEAHISLAHALFFVDWNFPEAEKEYQRAIKLTPNYPTAHHWYGNTYLSRTGRHDEALAEMKRAEELDPLSLIIRADFAESYLFARRYDEGIEQLLKTIEMDQTFQYAHWQLGMVYEMKGSFPEAIAEYLKARQLYDDPYVLGLLGHAYAMSGKRDEALKTLNQLKNLAGRRYVPLYGFVMIYAGLGDKDQAFQWLEKSYQAHEPKLTRIKVEPLLDNLHSDPRFGDLVRRIGLPQ
jgi:TolB-like protein/Flp pilus assembly protein TadD